MTLFAGAIFNDRALRELRPRDRPAAAAQVAHASPVLMRRASASAPAVFHRISPGFAARLADRVAAGICTGHCDAARASSATGKKSSEGRRTSDLAVRVFLFAQDNYEAAHHIARRRLCLPGPARAARLGHECRVHDRHQGVCAVRACRRCCLLIIMKNSLHFIVRRCEFIL